MKNCSINNHHFLRKYTIPPSMKIQNRPSHTKTIKINWNIKKTHRIYLPSSLNDHLENDIWLASTYKHINNTCCTKLNEMKNFSTFSYFICATAEQSAISYSMVEFRGKARKTFRFFTYFVKRKQKSYDRECIFCKLWIKIKFMSEKK